MLFSVGIFLFPIDLVQFITDYCTINKTFYNKNTFSGNGYYLYDGNNENGGDLCSANNSEVNNTSGNDTSSENNVISDDFAEPDDYVEPPEDGVVFTQNQIFVVSLWFWW